LRLITKGAIHCPEKKPAIGPGPVLPHGFRSEELDSFCPRHAFLSVFIKKNIAICGEDFFFSLPFVETME